jgi:hypothetical protein
MKHTYQFKIPKKKGEDVRVEGVGEALYRSVTHTHTLILFLEGKDVNECKCS